MDMLDDENSTMPPISSSLREQLAVMMKHEQYSRLLSELATPNAPLQKFLLRHPDDLFPRLDPEASVIPPEFSVSIPVLLWESSYRYRGRRKRPSIVDYMKDSGAPGDAEVNEELSEDNSVAAEESEIGDFEELVLLNGLHVLQHNPQLRRLVEQPDPVTLPQLRKALGSEGVNLKPLEDEFLHLMGNIAEEEGLGTMFRSLVRRSETDTESAYETKKMISEMYGYLRNLLLDLPTLIGRMHLMLPELTRKGSPFLQKHNAFIQRAYGMPPSKYLEAVNRLWELELIHPMIVNLVCKKCKDESGQPLSQVLACEISPKDLNLKPSCSWCGTPMVVQAFYGLDGWIQKCIHSQDRLLAYVIGYLLESKGMKWESRVQGPMSEHDFHVTTPLGIHLIECKVFACSATLKYDGGLRRKTQDGISQLISHMAETRVETATLVCNPFPFPSKVVDRWIVAELRRRKASDLIGRVRVAGIEPMPRILARMR